MGWSFRRSVKMGPLRLNVSTRGVGVSAGVRGARVNFGPRGTYVTVGRGGFQYRTKVDGPGRPLAPKSVVTIPVRSDEAKHEGAIATASASDLALSSPDEFLKEIQARLRKPNLFAWFLVAGVLTALFSGAPLGVGILVAAAAVPIFIWDRERRSARIIYDVDQTEVVERLALANEVGRSLGSTARLWHISHSVATTDQKKNAGASNLIRRTRIRSVPGSLPRVKLNVEPYCVPAGPQKVVMLPDRLLVWDGRTLAGVPYEHLVVSSAATRFIEEEGLPSDSRRVGTTWRYVNKQGGPDLRFKGNAELPVMEYGELNIESSNGLNLVFQTSNAQAAHAASSALSALGQKAFSDAPAHLAHIEARPEHAVPIPMHAPSPRDEQVELAGSVLTLMRYVAAADRRTDSGEVAFAHATTAQLLPPGHPELQRLADSFRTCAIDEASVSAALAAVGATSEEYRRWFLDIAERMTLADGKATPKERERVAELRRTLGV
ncbi:MAG: DUF4236 domain-containing protein [Polyangiaceae bacterium]|nr:DUF4236 domain-containing protein [Polyangiaceae bacterium]